MNRLLTAYDRLIEGLVGLAAAGVAAICLLIIWDVIARNAGLRPPDSTVALTEYALLYITLAVAPSLVRSRGHIVITLLLERLRPAPRRTLERAILLLCALLSVLVAGLAAVLALEAVRQGEIEVRSLDIPRAWLFAPLAVGFLLMAAEFLRLILRGESLIRPPAERAAL